VTIGLLILCFFGFLGLFYPLATEVLLKLGERPHIAWDFVQHSSVVGPLDALLGD